MSILLVEDHEVMRHGLRFLINNQAEMEVIAEAEDGLTSIELARELKPDVVILDLSLPDVSGIEATREIKRKVPNVKIITLSMYSDKRFVDGVLGAGAAGYLLKDCAFWDLPAAIRAVIADKVYLGAHLSRKTSIQEEFP